MNQKQNAGITLTALLIVAAIAVAAGVISVLLQHFLLGKSSPIVTGAIIGGVTGATFVTLNKKKPS